MANLKILVTGGSGLLGKEIQKHLKVIAPSHKELDITKKSSVRDGFRKYQPDIVVHLAAYTDVMKAQAEKKKCFEVNVWGTDLVACRSKFFIYLSTEYVFDGEKRRGGYHEGCIPNPVNFYSMTKLLGEAFAIRAKKYCIIRTLFKARPYKHKFVPTDMWTSGDYVDVIAKKIVYAIKNYDKLPKILHIGTGRKQLFELAKQTRKVIPIKRSDISIRLPGDTSLDTTLWEQLFREEI